METKENCAVCNCNRDPDDLISESIQKTIENICKTESYITYNVETKLLSTDGGSFLGKLYTADIKGRTEDGEKETHLFIKHIMPVGKFETIIDLKRAYLTEAYVYNELLRIFDELQDEAKIPKEERFRTVRSYAESDSEKLVLENVGIKGYKTCDRFYTMTLEVAERALAELAKWHALSFIMQEKRPAYYKKSAAISSAVLYSEEWEVCGLSVAKIAMRYLTGEVKKRVEEYMPEFLSEWKRYMLDQNTRCCLCHGDFRLNNILTKETNNKLTDLVTIDYQLIYYGNPINDFFYFLFTGTDQKFRRNHLLHLKNFYYDTLKDFLGKFSLNSEDIYPRKEFECDYKDRFNYGLISALYYLPFFLAEDGEIPDLGDDSMLEPDFNVHESFPERMQGVVEDCIEWGYL